MLWFVLRVFDRDVMCVCAVSCYARAAGCRFLLDQGATLDVLDRKFQTPLHLASSTPSVNNRFVFICSVCSD